jgi:predicted small lipoprotein YifL
MKKRFVLILTILILGTVINGCGRKGALTLPKPVELQPLAITVPVTI